MGTSDGTADTASIFKVGGNEGDVVGESDAVSVGLSVGTIVLVGTIVGVSAIANDGALVGNLVGGFVRFAAIGASDGVIVVALLVASVGAAGVLSENTMLPSLHSNVTSCK